MTSAPPRWRRWCSSAIELGLYRALAAGGAQTSAELARRTDTQRALRARMAQRACGLRLRASTSPTAARYQLTAEQATDVRRRGQPGVHRRRLSDRARRGPHHGPPQAKPSAPAHGIGWHEHDHGVFHGCARFYRAGYIGNLVQNWIPALDGVEARLKAGIRVADVGCGHGHSTILMAQAFPKSQFVGFDYHAGSIEVARERAREAGVASTLQLRSRRRQGFPGTRLRLRHRCSMRCMTWATRPALRATCSARWRRVAPG